MHRHFRDYNKLPPFVADYDQILEIPGQLTEDTCFEEFSPFMENGVVIRQPASLRHQAEYRQPHGAAVERPWVYGLTLPNTPMCKLNVGDSVIPRGLFNTPAIVQGKQAHNGRWKIYLSSEAEDWMWEEDLEKIETPKEETPMEYFLKNIDKIMGGGWILFTTAAPKESEVLIELILIEEINRRSYYKSVAKTREWYGTHRDSAFVHCDHPHAKWDKRAVAWRIAQVNEVVGRQSF